MKATRGQYIEAVARKLAANEEELRYGIMGKGKTLLRDNLGVQHTFSNILNVAGNLWDVQSGRDAFGETLANFSGSSYGDVSDVSTVGAIDVSIISATMSLVPYLAIDRSMSNPVDTIFYSNLTAVNSAGGVNEGDTVAGNFKAPNPNVTLGPNYQTLTGTGTGADLVLDFAREILPGTVTLAYTPDGGSEFVGRDFDSDGKIYFSGSDKVATVNYQTGEVTISSANNNDTAAVTALPDYSGEESGSGILKVKADHVPVQLVTEPRNVIFEENAHSNAYISKILANASQVGSGADQSIVHFQRITNTYIEDINRKLIILLKGIADAVGGMSTLNLATYTTDSYSSTKDDLVDRFFINMRTTLLSRTGQSATVCVTSTKGAAELQSLDSKFVSAPSFYTMQNGLVGTYDGVPIFRNNYLDAVETANSAEFYMATKLPDNSSGTMAFGEYLPLTSTPTVGNHSNPLQRSTGFFAQVGEKVIEGTVCQKGRITYA